MCILASPALGPGVAVERRRVAAPVAAATARARGRHTPTTKEEEHDRPISAEEIVSEGWMTQEDFDVCAEYVLNVFKFGQEKAAKNGLILVDTKFELGKPCPTHGHHERVMGFHIAPLGHGYGGPAGRREGRLSIYRGWGH